MKRILLLLFLVACSSPVETAIRDRQDHSVGTARFTATSEGTQLDLVAFNLPPGQHGVHIHENALCEPPDFATAGPHYNPERRQHGFNNVLGHHLGDLPAIDISSSGTGRARIIIPVELSDLREHAIIIHTDPDDYATDPSGKSGARIGCGIIR